MNYTANNKKEQKSKVAEIMTAKNKNINQNNAETVRDGFFNFKRIWGDLLPPPAILESYEEAAPGIVAEFGEILKVEQQHRHKLERKFYRSMARSMLLGQFFTLFIASGLIYATVFLIKQHQAHFTAAILCSFGFLFLIVANVVGIVTRGKIASYFPEHSVKDNLPVDNNEKTIRPAEKN